nr:immunoglobulin heavy chain junction region [Mus musculus]NSM07904.1 immunoglobulin heavy chain junction region [Mus musculus]NSM09573.1 immunoglobulin heavy chain junction region [Mus musculus]NSM09665.1 immunoglobulin heavy chain junction region [Mus musculus]
CARKDYYGSSPYGMDYW